MIYFAMRSGCTEAYDELIDVMERRGFKNELFIFGCIDRQIRGMQDMVPFTWFDVPFSYKVKLLLGELFFCIVLDIDSLKKILEKNNLECEIPEDRTHGVLKVSLLGDESSPSFFVWGLAFRMVYECLSVKTVLVYTQHAIETAKEFLKNHPNGQREKPDSSSAADPFI